MIADRERFCRFIVSDKDVCILMYSYRITNVSRLDSRLQEICAHTLRFVRRRLSMGAKEHYLLKSRDK
jgi:hypothetical protein